MIAMSHSEWAQQIFGGCELGDARRATRLADLGRRQGGPVGQLCLLRNPEVEAEAIADGGFAALARQHRHLFPH